MLYHHMWSNKTSLLQIPSPKLIASRFLATNYQARGKENDQSFLFILKFCFNFLMYKYVKIDMIGIIVSWHCSEAMKRIQETVAAIFLCRHCALTTQAMVWPFHVHSTIATYKVLKVLASSTYGVHLTTPVDFHVWVLEAWRFGRCADFSVDTKTTFSLFDISVSFISLKTFLRITCT